MKDKNFFFSTLKFEIDLEKKSFIILNSYIFKKNPFLKVNNLNKFLKIINLENNNSFFLNENQSDLNIIDFINQNRYYWKITKEFINLGQIKITNYFKNNIYGEIICIDFSNKELKINKNLNLIKEFDELEFSNYDDKLLEISKNYDKGIFIIYDFFNNEFFSSSYFVLINFLIFQNKYDNYQDYFLTKDKKIIFILKETINFSQENKYFLSFIKNNSLNLYNSFSTTIGFFDNHDFNNSFKYTIFKHTLLNKKSHSLSSSFLIRKKFSDYKNYLESNYNNLDNFTFYQNQSSIKEEAILELAIDIKINVLLYLFWVDKNLAYKIFIELIKKANNLSSIDSNIYLIIISIPLWFITFLSNDFFIEKNIIFNIQVNEIDNFNYEQETFLKKVRSINKENKFVLSIEYFQNNYICENFEQYNFKYFLFRKKTFLLLNEDFKINYDVRLIEAKAQILNKKILVI